MDLRVTDEFSELKKVAVCFGSFVPDSGRSASRDPEFLKFHTKIWDRGLLLKQQEKFFTLLQKYGVELIFIPPRPEFPHLMFTRDIGFVFGTQFIYAGRRKFGDRNGEVQWALKTINPVSSEKIDGLLEGGDVIISKDGLFAGRSSRTSKQAVLNLREKFPVKEFEIGNLVMHLDTRLTVLPDNYLLLYPGAFNSRDRSYLTRKFKIIEVNDKENETLGTNVFCLNPETIVAASEHPRIISELKKAGFKVETIEYSEPINLRGSFRCTTLPLVRG